MIEFSKMRRLEGVGAIRRALEERFGPGYEQEAREMACSVLECDLHRLILENDVKYSYDQQEALNVLLMRRLQGVPLQYLTHRAYFYGREFWVEEGVLIPRRDTETLVERALMKGGEQPLQILDVCCGSGCIGITLKLERPQWDATLADISGAALQIAEMNAARLGADVGIVRGDLFAPIGAERFDLILSNPPYIREQEIATLQREVRCHEPRLALSGGVDGLHFYRRIAKEAGEHLAPGGFVLAEIGYDQAKEVQAIFQREGYRDIEVFQDMEGRDRVIQARFG